MRLTARLPLALTLSCAVLLGGCASAASGPAAAPEPAIAARLAEATAPARRLHVVFDWNMSDRDARFQGQGVLRLEGNRGRVDLFGPRGETLAAAIVEGDSLRVVPAQAAAMLPPAALLWSTLGIFRQPADTPLTGTTTSGQTTRLDYARGSTRWNFRFDADRLRSAEWTDGSGRRTVELSGDAGNGVPLRATFRDWTAFRELTLNVRTVEERTSFEPDTWTLPGEG